MWPRSWLKRQSTMQVRTFDIRAWLRGRTWKTFREEAYSPRAPAEIFDLVCPFFSQDFVWFCIIFLPKTLFGLQKHHLITSEM
jgi:hypothetical protein